MILADRVKEITTTEGTGTVTLAGAAPGFRTFNAVCADGDVVPYCIASQVPGEWEVGIGQYDSGELERDTVLSSSNSNALVDFSAGAKDVFLTMPADELSVLPLRRVAGTLTAAQVLLLFTTPIEILPNVVGVTILPKYLYVRKPAGTAYTLNGSDSLRVNFDAASGAIVAFKVLAAGVFDQAAEKKAWRFGPTSDDIVASVGYGGASPISGMGLRWTVPTANWTLGDSDIHWQLYYHRLTET